MDGDIDVQSDGPVRGIEVRPTPTEEEKRVWDTVFDLSMARGNRAYEAIDDADQAVAAMKARGLL